MRTRLGLSQTDFGKALGVDQGAVSRWERAAKAPGMDALVKMARLGGVSMHFFHPGDEKSQQQADLLVIAAGAETWAKQLRDAAATLEAEDATEDRESLESVVLDEVRRQRDEVDRHHEKSG